MCAWCCVCVCRGSVKCVSAFICAAEKPSRTQVSDEISQHLQFPLMGGSQWWWDVLWRIIFQVISNISMLTTRAKKKSNMSTADILPHQGMLRGKYSDYCCSRENLSTSWILIQQRRWTRPNRFIFTFAVNQWTIHKARGIFDRVCDKSELNICKNNLGRNSWHSIFFLWPWQAIFRSDPWPW